ncbi:MAG: hypothetical protein R6U26_01450 [Candidatus Undinarchaeales archaeon]
MKTGNVIKKAFDLYLTNPVIIVPFLILGAVTNTINFILKTFLRESFANFKFTGMQSLLFLENISESFFQNFLQYSIFFILIGIFILILSSFLEAYAIGLSKKLTTNKAKLSDGLSAMIHGPAIIGKNLIIWLLFFAGSIVVIIPTVILFGALGFLLATVILFVYMAILIAVSFFANQSIVLDNVGPWEGLVGSYFFIKKNIEGVALLILFVVGIYVAFGIVQSTGATMVSYFLSETTELVVNQGLHLILYSLILYPFVLILKTFYYIKNK